MIKRATYAFGQKNSNGEWSMEHRVPHHRVRALAHYKPLAHNYGVTLQLPPLSPTYSVLNSVILDVLAWDTDSISSPSKKERAPH